MVFLKFMAFYLSTGVAGFALLFVLFPGLKGDARIIYLIPFIVMVSSFIVELGRLLYFSVLARREGRKMNAEEKEELGSIIAEVFASLNMKPVPVKVNESKLGPCAIGGNFLPTIMFPSDCLYEDPNVFKGTLAHECIHIIRDDTFRTWFIRDYFRALLTVAINVGICFALIGLGVTQGWYILAHIALYIGADYLRKKVTNAYGEFGNILNHRKEYRCDMEAALAVGKENVFQMLHSILDTKLNAHDLLSDEKGFKELLLSGAFKSTHPPTSERIKRVRNL